MAYRRLATATDDNDLRKAATTLLDDKRWRLSILALTEQTPWALVLQWTPADLGANFPMPYEDCVESGLVSQARSALIHVMRAVAALSTDSRVVHDVTPEQQFDFYADRRIPRAIRKAIYERDIASICLMALIGGWWSNGSFRTHQVELLYTTWVTGLCMWFDLIAACFGVLDIPDELRCVTDWENVFAEHEKTRGAAASAHQAFVAGGSRPMLVIPQNHDKDG